MKPLLKVFEVLQFVTLVVTLVGHTYGNITVSLGTEERMKMPRFK
jgi:hypothetical protein